MNKQELNEHEHEQGYINNQHLFVFVYIRLFVCELWLCVREQAVFANVHEHVRSGNLANINHWCALTPCACIVESGGMFEELEFAHRHTESWRPAAVLVLVVRRPIVDWVRAFRALIPRYILPSLSLSPSLSRLPTSRLRRARSHFQPK